MKILVFALDLNRYGIPLENVAFVRPVEDQTDIKGTVTASRHMKGYILSHGTCIQIYSLTSLLGFSEREIRQVVGIKANGIQFGLGVDRVEGIIEVREEDVLPVPVCASTAQSCLKSIVEHPRKQLIFLIDVHKLVSYEDAGRCIGRNNWKRCVCQVKSA